MVSLIYLLHVNLTFYVNQSGNQLASPVAGNNEVQIGLASPTTGNNHLQIVLQIQAPESIMLQIDFPKGRFFTEFLSFLQNY